MIDAHVRSIDETARQKPLVLFGEFVLLRNKALHHLRRHGGRDVEIVGERDEVGDCQVAHVSRATG